MSGKRDPADFNVEIESHIRIEADRLRERGMSDDEALAAARRAFGNVTRTQERFYESGRWLWWDTLSQDIRIGVRLLAKTPAWTTTAVTTAALGIGATAAIFSVVNTALLRPLPFPKPDQLYAVVERLKSVESGLAPDYFTMRENLHGSYGSSIQDMAAYDSAGVNWRGDDRAERFVAGEVTASLFSTLQVQPLYGRGFRPEEDRPEADPVVVLSYPLWQRRFGGDAAIIGRRIRLNRTSALVIGVMPASFDFPKGSDLWVPLALDEAVQRQRRIMAGVGIVARSTPGATPSQVNTELEALMGVVKNEYPQKSANARGYPKDFIDSMRASVLPLQEQLVGNMRPVLSVFSGAVALMLLIVCFTVANLMLARASARQREVAVRMALGSRRRRIFCQFLTESLLVSLFGGMLGVAVMEAAVAAFNVVRLKVLPALPEIVVDFRTAGFTIAITVLTGLAFGLAPSLGSISLDVRDALKGESRSASSRTSVRRMRQVLVAAQLGLSLMLLIGAGLMARSFYNMRNTDPGFDAENVLTARIRLAGPGYETLERQRQFIEELIERLRRLPGVQWVAIGPVAPGISGNSIIFTAENQPAGERAGDPPRTMLSEVSADYFRALGVRLVHGRQISVGDGRDAPLVIVVNEAFARTFFPGQNPIGHRISTNPGESDPRWAEIVGVVGDVRQTGLDQEVTPTAYRSFLQEPNPALARADLLIRTSGDPALLVPPLEAVVASMDRDEPVFDIKTMDERLSDSLISRRFDAVLTAAFAAVALLLAAIGVYGVMSYVVTLRIPEFGIRLALGARRVHLWTSIFREGLVLAAIGGILGLAGAFVLSRYLAVLLYGVGTHDPTTYTAAAFATGGAVIAACLVPGRRAAQIDPATALRHD